jgi:hypothetical protein
LRKDLSQREQSIGVRADEASIQGMYPKGLRGQQINQLIDSSADLLLLL